MRDEVILEIFRSDEVAGLNSNSPVVGIALIEYNLEITGTKSDAIHRV